MDPLVRVDPVDRRRLLAPEVLFLLLLPLVRVDPVDRRRLLAPEVLFLLRRLLDPEDLLLPLDPVDLQRLIQDPLDPVDLQRLMQDQEVPVDLQRLMQDPADRPNL